jgi:regulator of replication initiation timing
MLNLSLDLSNGVCCRELSDTVADGDACETLGLSGVAHYSMVPLNVKRVGKQAKRTNIHSMHEGEGHGCNERVPNMSMALVARMDARHVRINDTMDELSKVKAQVRYLTKKNLDMQTKNDELQVELGAVKEELELETSEKKRIRGRFIALNAEFMQFKGELEPLDDFNVGSLTDSDEEDEPLVVNAVNLTPVVVHVPAYIDLTIE